jgi:SPP1 family predicted phage head-tail adaptor
MSAGAKDQQVTLQRLTIAPDGMGGQTEAWADFAEDATVWAHVVAKSGREGMIEGRTADTFIVLFTIWNRRDIDARDRIIWQGVAYNIRGVRDVGGRSLDLVIEAERGVAQ